MGNAFRQQPGPALYGPNKTPWQGDLLEVGFAFACAMIAFSFILIIPGIRGWERLWACIRVFGALWVGIIILECNFGYAWYEDEIKEVHTQYKAFTTNEIVADIGLHIGLRGINVTLKGVPEIQFGERINYNDAYRWSDPWAQGRLGYGRFAGRFNQEFRASQFRGVPYPTQWIAEYFTLDGEQIRWGRRFRVAGWYAHIFLWLSFAVYLITMILFWLVVRLGAIAMVWLGVLMILSIFFYGIIIINDPELKIPFADGNIIEPHFGWSFYLNLFTGIGCVLVGLLIWALDYFVPRKIAIVFNHSVIEDDEFFEEQEPEAEQPATLDEYGASTRGVRKTQRGLTRYRQTQRKPRGTLRSGGSVRHSQRLKDESSIPLEEMPQGPVSITVQTKS